MTTSGSRPPQARRRQEIDDWVAGYVKRHPSAAIATGGNQAILALRTIQTLFIDIFTGKFQWGEFVRQAAFMAGTSVAPTIMVALPIGVTLSVQFALLAGQVGATSMAGAASGGGDPAGGLARGGHHHGRGRRLGDHRGPGLPQDP